MLFTACGSDDQKQNQTIQFDILPSLFEGEEYILSASSSSGLQVSFRSTDSDYATVESNVLKAVKGGTVSIIAYQAGNDDFYEAPQIRQFMTIYPYSADKKDQTISFELDIDEWKISQGMLLMKGYARASSGLPVTFTSSRESAATISENGELNVVFGAERQTITIYASQSGNNEYNPAKTVSQKLTVVCDQH